MCLEGFELCVEDLRLKVLLVGLSGAAGRGFVDQQPEQSPSTLRKPSTLQFLPAAYALEAALSWGRVWCLGTLTRDSPKP